MTERHSERGFKREMRAIAIYCWHHTEISQAKLNQILNCPNESAFQNMWSYFSPQYHLPSRAETVNAGEILESAYALEQSKLFCAGDAGYPDALYVLQSPPILSVRGDVSFLSKPQVALVGSRAVHALSQSMTQQIAEEAIRRSLIITSGGALGIDSFAHRCAMTHQQPTIVVSAMGTQLSYPKENQDIFDYAGRYGAIVSQFPNRPVAHKPNFPQRNDIIAALSLATIIVQSRPKGGSLYTAKTALKLSRPVYVAAMPGFDQLTLGGLQLVQQGKAKLLCSAEDLDDIIPIHASDDTPVQPMLPALFPTEPTISLHETVPPQDTRGRIIQALQKQRYTREQLRSVAELPDDFDEALLDLELDGAIIYTGGNYTLGQSV